MNTHLSQLPAPGAYASSWQRVFRAQPGTRFNAGWPRGVISREDALRDFREALDRRISARGNLHRTGRKFDESFQIDLRRDAADLHARITQRVRVYRFRCKDMNKRFAHLLASHDD